MAKKKTTYEKLFKPVQTKMGEMIHPPLFMTAKEILDVAQPLDTITHGSTPEEVMSSKLKEVQEADPSGYNHPIGGMGDGSGVLSSIQHHGYDWNQPIPISMRRIEFNTPQQRWGGWPADALQPTVVNGQHRLAVMAHYHPDMEIPVTVGNSMRVFDDYRINKKKLSVDVENAKED